MTIIASLVFVIIGLRLLFGLVKILTVALERLSKGAPKAPPIARPARQKGKRAVFPADIGVSGVEEAKQDLTEQYMAEQYAAKQDIAKQDIAEHSHRSDADKIMRANMDKQLKSLLKLRDEVINAGVSAYGVKENYIKVQNTLIRYNNQYSSSSNTSIKLLEELNEQMEYARDAYLVMLHKATNIDKKVECPVSPDKVMTLRMKGYLS